MGIFQKEDNYVSYEFNKCDIESQKSIFELLLQKQKKEGDLQRLFMEYRKKDSIRKSLGTKAWMRPGEQSPAIPKHNNHGNNFIPSCIRLKKEKKKYFVANCYRSFRHQ